MTEEGFCVWQTYWLDLINEERGKPITKQSWLANYRRRFLHVKSRDCHVTQATAANARANILTRGNSLLRFVLVVLCRCKPIIECWPSALHPWVIGSNPGRISPRCFATSGELAEWTRQRVESYYNNNNLTQPVITGFQPLCNLIQGFLLSSARWSIALDCGHVQSFFFVHWKLSVVVF